MSAEIGLEFSVNGGSLAVLLAKAALEGAALFGEANSFRIARMEVTKDGLTYRARVRVEFVPRSLLLDEGIERIEVEPEFQFPWFRRRRPRDPGDSGTPH